VKAITLEQRHSYARHWKRATFGKRALAAIAAGAGINQLCGHTGQWGGGVAGLGSGWAPVSAYTL
jgi:hypothetical protein